MSHLSVQAVSGYFAITNTSGYVGVNSAATMSVACPSGYYIGSSGTTAWYAVFIALRCVFAWCTFLVFELLFPFDGSFF